MNYEEYEYVPKKSPDENIEDFFFNLEARLDEDNFNESEAIEELKMLILSVSHWKFARAYLDRIAYQIECCLHSERKRTLKNEMLRLVFEALNQKPEPLEELPLHPMFAKEQKEKPEAEKLNWQGTQAQLVYLIEQLYEQGLLSAITQPEKFALLSQHFTIKGKPLSSQSLSQTKQNNLNNKGGKPKGVEGIEKIISTVKAVNSENQNGKKV